MLIDLFDFESKEIVDFDYLVIYKLILMLERFLNMIKNMIKKYKSNFE